MRARLFVFTLYMILSFFCCVSLRRPQPATEKVQVVVTVHEKASQTEILAAREIVRYLYLRTGRIVPISASRFSTPGKKDVVLVACRDRFDGLEKILSPGLLRQLNSLKNEEYMLKSHTRDNRKIIVIAGGDDIGTLYGAYRFAELLGVRFYLHGDVIPDNKIELKLPEVDEKSAPLFELRGIHPFHDFPEGPDWWDLDGYKAVISQLPKLRMNFFALHTYPEGHPNAEPTVWIGLAQDVLDDGNVRFSYASSYMNTLRGNWGYEPKKTSDFSCGAALLFDRDDYGPDVMGDWLPEAETMEASNEIFNRTALMLREAFQHAHRLGVKTCVGTEIPMTIPELLQDGLRQLGKNPADPSVVLELYKGIFIRILRSYPIDYYWLWSPERWTWGIAGEEEIEAAKNDLLLAITAASAVNAPFRLATCGWVLGPQNDRTLFDRILPKEIPMSCINRRVGHAPIERGFAEIQDRPKWAIPWLEDDPALTSPQLWVGRMRADAVDALRYGCTGLLGIHWRTRILGPNVSALAKAAWDQDDWVQAKLESEKQTKQEGAAGGKHKVFSDADIESTPDDSLYRSVCVGLNGYRLPVPNGKYTVTLKFCELEEKQPWKRVFSVEIEGKKVLDRLDIFAEGGPNAALDYAFHDIEIKDGWVDIVFLPDYGEACVSAISVESPRYTKRINCGGFSYRDYVADLPPSDPLLRDTPTEDFYLDWAVHQFGPAPAADIARIFSGIDGRLPRPSQWVHGPGGIKPDDRPWEEVRKRYSFVEELAALRPKVKGKGNLERFDYWLNNFKYMKATARVNCIWGEYNRRLEEILSERPELRRKRAENEVLPLRRQLIRAVSDVYKYLLLTVGNSGEMGTLANWEQHILPDLLTDPGKELADILGGHLPRDAQLSKEYKGPTRIIVPVVRTIAEEGETLTLKVIILSKNPLRNAQLHWREMGRDEFHTLSLVHVARGVYSVRFPHEATTRTHLEYYLSATPRNGKTVYFPATAPEINQTVVILPPADTRKAGPYRRQ